MLQKTLAIDPSGNFSEGKGTTGFALFHGNTPIRLWQIHAKEYPSAPAYWDAVLNEIEGIDEVVCEEYPLYDFKGQSAKTQSWSLLETPQLIGAITIECYRKGYPIHFQKASLAKSRFKEDLLVRKGFLEKKGNKYIFQKETTTPHMRDALKHGLYHTRYRQEKVTS